MTYSHGSDEDRRKRVSFVIDLVTARCENVLVAKRRLEGCEHVPWL